MTGSKPRRTWAPALMLCLAVAGCTGAGASYVPAQNDQTTSVRSGPDGGDSGGSSM